MRRILLFCILLNGVWGYSQNVAINNTGTTANTNAILDVDISTNNKGVLIPRLSTAQRIAIPGLGAADQGLLVFDETTNGFWYWDGTQWLQMLNDNNGWKTLGNTGTNPANNFIGTTDNVDLVTRTANVERMRVTNAGNVGIGTPAPAARLQVTGGAIMPQSGNTTASGIYFPPNPGGGGGDEAYIRNYAEAGENTKLVIGVLNDADDDIALVTGAALERVNINGYGTVRLNRSVLFDCNDCGSTTAYDIGDATGANYGDLVIQGRVLSTNSNLHLSPPGGTKVIINSQYRAAGGATGNTGLDIEDGGIRMRKNYFYFQRYFYTTSANGVDASGTYNLGNWDFCALAQAGFKNNASNTDEDDDVQCAVYPNGAGVGETTNYDYYYTEQFNSRRFWYMYMEGFEDTNGVTCSANCMNFE